MELLECCRYLMLVLALGLAGCPAVAEEARAHEQGRSRPFRPPAVPLVTHDPYFSVWSSSDELNADWPRHWTGTIHAMAGMLRVDGEPFRFMGLAPDGIATARQVNLTVLPTRTIYVFEAGGVELTVTFLTPALPTELDVLSRPVTYVVCSARSSDGAAHDVQVYLDATAEWAVNDVRQHVVWDRPAVDGLTVLRVGTEEQPVLEKKGDDLRIDWGHLYIAAPGRVDGVIASDEAARGAFAAGGSLPAGDDGRMPRAASDQWPVLAIVNDLGDVGREPVSRRFMIAYDDGYSIKHMGEKLRAWWKRDGMSTAQLLIAADSDFEKLAQACAQFDEQLMAGLRAAGGEDYARLCALAYRQCIAAHKLVASADGETPLYFSKENFSNGCIATVDVTYPSSPMFLLLNPTLLKGMLTPILDYSASDQWKFPFAPHDLGTYPIANGQVYGGGETIAHEMPVEECGNMLIMLGAIAKAEGNADYAAAHWPVVTQWAQYLREKGLDPENQITTDDFAGHLAHNANLSLKAIIALGSYARMCEMLGKTEDAQAYRKLAEEMAVKWQEMADDGDHYRLAFDRPGTWSQKYNLVWDKVLGLNLFPDEVARKEVAFYKTKLQEFGLPLDSRENYTKLDWVLWSATLADNQEDFQAILAPSYAWVSVTPQRVPLTDWYGTTDAVRMNFTARSVVGGFFIKMLEDEGAWKKWVSRSNARQ